ncbi:type VI secretion system tip protein TssI/VgrG [Nannocystis pusilla]|uniref:Type VI secretion system tip protein VgrG n=1 Tax=Nannocystis pusilla TaxID=889268 RepID=A0ABS7TWR0_9BACT|nr:type VI secretion system tip protein TssI/VgrG [Nannocystis pusilla]MBZ5712703.1 type VI secretion system tip protein VgrG [Nannocystis pusilla]
MNVGDRELRAVRFSGQEAISGLYEFRVEVAANELDLEDLLDAPALLTIRGMDEARLVHGFVTEAEYVGHTTSFELYELTIVPWAHRLLHRQSSRIFQDMTTQQIVSEVLRTAGLDADMFRFSLVGAYERRDYCVQYRESDFAFVSRLLEEDGIFYFFEHEADKHVWVMGDNVNVHPPIAGNPTVLFNPQIDVSVQSEERVRSFRFGGRVRPGKVSLRDFNLHRPDQAMEVQATGKTHRELEVYDYPGEYQDPGRGGPHQGQQMAKIRLEALQATRRLGSGVSDSPRLTPGYFMILASHPRPEFDGEYRVLQVHHVGAQPQVLDQEAAGESSYHNTFTATELKVPYRPPRTTSRPTVRGVQTATVVGPEGEEIHVDRHGRVRVQFHWDRDGKFDERSATWVRVSQMWAGNRYGAMFLPRIGHEVLVDFIEGDPDRPVITGRIYHGLNEPPYPLPDEKTKSTIKSDSSLGGGGFNELRFEDRKGSEEIFLHAQKDWNTVILHNHSENVGVNRSANIGAVDSVVVGRVQTITIKQPPPPDPPPPPIPPTGTAMSDKFFSLTTGLATVTVNGADVTIDATGTVNIHSVGAMSINSDAALSISGKSVEINASTTMKVAGKASVDVTSSGPTTISGTPVQLNGPGLFAGRVTELAPAAITTGAALVVIGGASFPLPVVKLPDGSLQVGDHITVQPGTGRYADFQNKVMRDLGIMASTPSGLQRLNNIENNPNGHNLTIREYSAAEEATYGPNNSLCYPGAGQNSDNALRYDADGNPVPGPGSDTQISYNPDIVLGPAGSPEPGDATLFHEMGHAEHNVYGTNRQWEGRTDGYENNEEWQTINDGTNRPGSGSQVPGVPASPSENDYLGDRNYPYRRTDHGSGYSNPDGSPITP